MLYHEHKRTDWDVFNWCVNSEQIMQFRQEFPFESRKNIAFWHGAGTGLNRKYSGFMTDFKG